MDNNKIGQIISSFSPRERQQFEDFLDSGLVSQNANAKKLFGILKEDRHAEEKERYFSPRDTCKYKLKKTGV